MRRTHKQLTRLISRIRFTDLVVIGGRPPLERDFQRQKARYLRRCQPMMVLGLVMVKA